MLKNLLQNIVDFVLSRTGRRNCRKKSLIKYGAPVYVRHEIVHNKFVVNNLKKGIIFVESLDEVPKETNQPVIFSAHGVAKRVIEKAKNYNLLFYDAICPW